MKQKWPIAGALNYPQGKLQVVWITDGSNDHTNEKLARYPEVKVLYRPQRQGKTAALNRAVPLIDTPYIVFTDANTILNTEAILEIVQCFGSEKTGGVAGEKRISVKDKDNATAGGEGFYWKYESRLKAGFPSFIPQSVLPENCSPFAENYSNRCPRILYWMISSYPCVLPKKGIKLLIAIGPMR